MAAALLITFRETLEASLIVVIVMTILDRMGRNRLRMFLWNGVMAGLLLSLVLALLVQWVFTSLGAHAEELAEGVTMLAASALITWMVLWMSRAGISLRSKITARATEHADAQSAVGVFLMSFFAVAREGTETVLFLQASLLHTQEVFQEIGAIAGILLALGVSFLLFRGFSVLPLRWVFKTTSVLLILFAAGLIAHGLHELQEAGMLTFGSHIVWNINPVIAADGAYPLLHDHGLIGGTLRSLVGYNGDPTVLELGAYLAYLAGVGTWVFRRAQHA